MNAAVARSDVELRMMEAMVDCAQALGMGFGEAAQAEPDVLRRLTLYDAFHRGFQAVRLGIRLSLTLRAGRAPAAASPRRAADADVEVAERPEAAERQGATDPREAEPARDRERDYEPVSLAKFLSRLRGVAADARGLPAKTDATVVSRLEGLLAGVDGAPEPETAPPSGVALRVRPSASLHKSRLLGSAAPRLTLDGPGRPRPPPFASG